MTMKTSNSKAAHETLKAARELLAKRGAWTKGAAARDKTKREVSPFDRDAVMFCSLGAIARVTPRPITERWAAEDLLTAFAPKGGVAEFNDAKSTRKKDVLAMFDRAIAATAPKKRK